MNENLRQFTKDLPDAASADRFFDELPTFEVNKLLKNKGLLSDILALASYSPLLATTLLQNPSYIAWLKRKRLETQIPSKEELLESLARFAATNSQVDADELFARFRRRELLRIYLKDIRGIYTIAEITEEISVLADAILEKALQIAKQELDNRYGIPLETDEKGRAKPATFCIVALGKLGSNELNYASDIDLSFIYSADGTTSGHGRKGETSNREYFVKLAEFIVKLTGQKAYRVDMRLRPHGKIGALAISSDDAIRYYKREAHAWERQVLIRSRSSAGDGEIFKSFIENLENIVFSKDETVENALQNVRLSKEKINLEKLDNKDFNVKLGIGGIREIEFIAQALQLAHGGRDKWLRSPHTLISLSRMADRKLLSENDLTELFEAYNFLRRLEHRVQMENGLQTHLIPNNAEKRLIVAKRMNLHDLSEFDETLKLHTANVNRIFIRIFGDFEHKPQTAQIIEKIPASVIRNPQTDVFASLKKSDVEFDEKNAGTLKTICEHSTHFAELLTSNPNLINSLPTQSEEFDEKNYIDLMLSAVKNETEFAKRLAVLRKIWSQCLLEIAAFDIFGKLTLTEAKQRQTKLAEASLETAIFTAKSELERRLKTNIDELNFAVLGLGKLGGRGMDYGSDLDLVLLYDDDKPCPLNGLTHAEFYSRFVELLVTTLSSFTREGHLYRVDLRLRPDGKNGSTSMSKSSFLGYLQNRSAIWELLAYVKIRGVIGGTVTENEARNIIHAKAQTIDVQQLKTETSRMRERLEQEKSAKLDIKFGSGGMLDVYFAMRFLQLRDNIPDDVENRSTRFMLKKLHEKGSLDKENFGNFYNGYEFLSRLDHVLRLTVGRSNSLPTSNLDLIAKRLNLLHQQDLIEQLTLHRLNIRETYDRILL
jgi:[glutamine synthetase] adenylyltransferase / [glutamine synthetase]-adenylyl-L-tyrosine phosphorylase